MEMATKLTSTSLSCTIEFLLMWRHHGWISYCQVSKITAGQIIFSITVNLIAAKRDAPSPYEDFAKRLEAKTKRPTMNRWMLSSNLIVTTRHTSNVFVALAPKRAYIKTLKNLLCQIVTSLMLSFSYIITFSMIF